MVILPSHFWRAPVCSSFSALPLLPSLFLMQVDTGDPLSGSPSGRQVMSLGTVTANYTCKHLKTEHKLENLSRTPSPLHSGHVDTPEAAAPWSRRQAWGWQL